MTSTGYDVLVIGGGPCGLITAREAAKEGLKVLVLEEHKVIGKPMHCAGVISPRCLRELGIRVTGHMILNEIKGAKLYFPGGNEVEVSRGQVEAIVVDREVFDRELAREAEDAGAEIITSCKAEKISPMEDVAKVLVRCGREEIIIRCKTLVIAEGLVRTLTRELTPIKAKPLTGLQEDYELHEIHIEKDYVKVYFDKRISDRLFGWIIPLGEDRVRVGTASGRAHIGYRELLSRKEVENMIRGARRIRRMGGIVNVDGPLNTFVLRPNVALVGDAAGQNKPVTGGGVYYGGVGGMLLGRAIVRAVEEGGLRQFYEGAWRMRFGRDIMVASLFRRFFDSLTNRDLEVLGKVVQEVSEEIVRNGDFDFHARLLMKGGIKVLLRALRRGEGNIYKAFIRALIATILR